LSTKISVAYFIAERRDRGMDKLKIKDAYRIETHSPYVSDMLSIIKTEGLRIVVKMDRTKSDKPYHIDYNYEDGQRFNVYYDDVKNRDAMFDKVDFALNVKGEIDENED